MLISSIARYCHRRNDEFCVLTEGFSRPNAAVLGFVFIFGLLTECVVISLLVYCEIGSVIVVPILTIFTQLLLSRSRLLLIVSVLVQIPCLRTQSCPNMPLTDSHKTGHRSRGQKLNRYNLGFLIVILLVMFVEEPLTSYLIISPLISASILILSIFVLLWRERLAAMFFLSLAVPILLVHFIVGMCFIIYGVNAFEINVLSEMTTHFGALLTGCLFLLILPFLMVTASGFLHIYEGRAAHEVGMITKRRFCCSQ
ncbi:hypothetical protein M3Y98_01166000 [Aphelenchoides besseyi]|nr:hypothetical protein M3Y98_01166000 [Aphelenchoides besseyi]